MRGHKLVSTDQLVNHDPCLVVNRRVREVLSLGHISICISHPYFMYLCYLTLSPPSKVDYLSLQTYVTYLDTWQKGCLFIYGFFKTLLSIKCPPTPNRKDLKFKTHNGFGVGSNIVLPPTLFIYKINLIFIILFLIHK